MLLPLLLLLLLLVLLAGRWSIGTESADQDLLFVSLSAAQSAVLGLLLPRLLRADGGGRELAAALALHGSWKDEEPLSEAGVGLALAGALGVLAVGAVLWQRSPFLGVVLYAVAASGVVREGLATLLVLDGTMRNVLLGLVLGLSFLSRTIFRFNFACFMFIISTFCLLSQEEFDEVKTAIGYPGFLTFALLVGLIVSVVHDVVARFAYGALSGIAQAFLLAITAFVLVDTALEFLGLNLSRTAGNSRSTRQLLSRSWNDPIEAFIANEPLEMQIYASLPIISAWFCMSGVVRALNISKSANSLALFENASTDIFGLAAGGFVGLWLWAQCAGFRDIDIFGPSCVTFVFAILLVRVSAILPVSSLMAQKSWNVITYWRRFSTSTSGKIGSSVAAGKAPPSATAQPQEVAARVVGSFVCGVDPNVQKVAFRELEAIESLKSAQAKVQELNRSRPVDAVAVAKAMYQVAVQSSTVSKLADELLVKVRAVVTEVDMESHVLMDIGTNDIPLPAMTPTPTLDTGLLTNDMKTKIKTKLKDSLSRHKELIQELKTVEDDAVQKRMSMDKLEDAALAKLREVSIKVQAGDKPTADELMRLSDALQTKRKKGKLTAGKGSERTFQEDVEITKARLAQMDATKLPPIPGPNGAASRPKNATASLSNNNVSAMASNGPPRSNDAPLRGVAGSASTMASASAPTYVSRADTGSAGTVTGRAEDDKTSTTSSAKTGSSKRSLSSIFKNPFRSSKSKKADPSSRNSSPAPTPTPTPPPGATGASAIPENGAAEDDTASSAGKSKSRSWFSSRKKAV